MGFRDRVNAVDRIKFVTGNAALIEQRFFFPKKSNLQQINSSNVQKSTIACVMVVATLQSETEVFMQYLLALYASESGWNTLTPEQQQQGYVAYMAYTEALKTAGAYVGSNRLQPVSTATTVRLADGKPQVLDGPYVESKEQLGGYYLIEAADLDAALAWAARCPGAGHGIVEVRPVWATSSPQYFSPTN
jgi:hypothetical protein